jgi:hypothetical protein
MGLRVNEKKTKHMVVQRGGAPDKSPLQAGEHTYGTVSSFKYLGAVFTEDGTSAAEVMAKKRSGMRAYGALRCIMRSKKSYIP